MLQYEALQILAPSGGVVTIDRGASPDDAVVRLIAPKGQVFALGGKGRQRVCEIEAWAIDTPEEVSRTVREYFECLLPIGK